MKMAMTILFCFCSKEEKLREYRREKRKDIKKRKHDEVSAGADDDGDDEMAAMMGFSGFGSSKK